MPNCADMRALGAFAASHLGTFRHLEAATNGINRNDLTRLLRDHAVVRVRQGVYRFADVDVGWKHEL